MTKFPDGKAHGKISGKSNHYCNLSVSIGPQSSPKNYRGSAGRAVSSETGPRSGVRQRRRGTSARAGDTRRNRAWSPSCPPFPRQPPCRCTPVLGPRENRHAVQRIEESMGLFDAHHGRQSVGDLLVHDDVALGCAPHVVINEHGDLLETFRSVIPTLMLAPRSRVRAKNEAPGADFVLGHVLQREEVVHQRTPRRTLHRRVDLRPDPHHISFSATVMLPLLNLTLPMRIDVGSSSCCSSRV